MTREDFEKAKELLDVLDDINSVLDDREMPLGFGTMVQGATIQRLARVTFQKEFLQLLKDKKDEYETKLKEI